MQTQQRTHCPIFTQSHLHCFVEITKTPKMIRSSWSRWPSCDEWSSSGHLILETSGPGHCSLVSLFIPKKMICIFQARFHGFLLNKYNKTRQFTSISRQVRARFSPNFRPGFFWPGVHIISDILTPKWAMIDAGHELDVRTKLIINKMLTRADVRG